MYIQVYTLPFKSLGSLRFFLKIIFLFRKDGLNHLKATIKIFMLSQQIFISDEV